MMGIAEQKQREKNPILIIIRISFPTVHNLNPRLWCAPDL